MEEQLLAKLDAWLSYFSDLGIGDFYRNRESMRSTEASRPDAKREKAAVSPPGPAAPTSSYLRDEKAPLSHRPVPTTPSSAENRSDAAEQFPPVLSSASLFEAASRIEGDTLERIRTDIGDCTRCKLHRSRTHIVYGDGDPRARLVFVGEGPGQEEDLQGLPFVGRAGKLLNQMIEAMGLHRRDVYIANVVKCRPPQNRTPEKDETSTCGQFLDRQLGVIAPKVIVTLGNVATQKLLDTTEPMARLRGRWFRAHGARLLPTYHPAYLLRNPNAKGVVWEDLQKVMAELGLKPPKSAKKSR